MAASNNTIQGNRIGTNAAGYRRNRERPRRDSASRRQRASPGAIRTTRSAATAAGAGEPSSRATPALGSCMNGSVPSPSVGNNVIQGKHDRRYAIGDRQDSAAISNSGSQGKRHHRLRPPGISGTVIGSGGRSVRATSIAELETIGHSDRRVDRGFDSVNGTGERALARTGSMRTAESAIDLGWRRRIRQRRRRR